MEKNKNEFDEPIYLPTVERTSLFNKVIRRLNEHCNYSKDKKVLEVGCGAGSFNQLLNSENYHGITKRMKEYMISKMDNVILGDQRSLPYKDGYFDVIINYHTLEYVTEQTESISEMVRCTKNKGHVVVVYDFVGEGPTKDYFSILSKKGMDKIFHSLDCEKIYEEIMPQAEGIDNTLLIYEKGEKIE